MVVAILFLLPRPSLAQVLQPPVLIGPGQTQPPPQPPPPSTGGAPLSWNDARFANATSVGWQTVSNGGSLTDRSITQTGSEASIKCNGACSLTRVRVDSKEALRWVSGAVTITDTWLEAEDVSPAHADVIQGYGSGNGSLSLTRTTIRAYNHDATAGIWVDDSPGTRTFTLQDVVFWGGPFGWRMHTRGSYTYTLVVNNVCFISGSFGYEPIWLQSYDGGRIVATQWNNVNHCSVSNGQLVVGAPISCASELGAANCP